MKRYNYTIWKLTNCSLRLRNLGKLYDTTALRARTLIQDLRKLDLAGRLEQLDQVLVRSRPRQLSCDPIQASHQPQIYHARLVQTLTLRTMICCDGSGSKPPPNPPAAPYAPPSLYPPRRMLPGWSGPE